MYNEFYGLTEAPFELNPNPKYLLLTARHREALANLQYGISARKALTLLLGEAGTGKTTLVHAALASESCRSARILHLANPVLSRAEFLEFLARSFDLSPEARRSKTTLLFELERVLLEQREKSITTALVVDEAQSLPDELLEEIRLLSNIETQTDKLLPLVLAGQPELSDRLSQPSLRQLKQRVALRCTLDLLDLLETSAYIAGRIRKAGGQCSAIFTREAIALIHERSGGVPRTISVICDNALVSGFASATRPVGVDIVREVCEEFDLKGVAKGLRRPGQPAKAAARSGAPKAAAVAPAAAPAGGAAAAAPRVNRLFANFGRKRGFSFF
jgi:type II secretory pathway predicted ATPase ExeA